jgi:hypothetical protein
MDVSSIKPMAFCIYCVLLKNVIARPALYAGRGNLLKMTDRFGKKRLAMTVLFFEKKPCGATPSR